MSLLLLLTCHLAYTRNYHACSLLPLYIMVHILNMLHFLHHRRMILALAALRLPLHLCNLCHRRMLFGLIVAICMAQHGTLRLSSHGHRADTLIRIATFGTCYRRGILSRSQKRMASEAKHRYGNALKALRHGGLQALRFGRGLGSWSRIPSLPISTVTRLGTRWSRGVPRSFVFVARRDLLTSGCSTSRQVLRVRLFLMPPKVPRQRTQMRLHVGSAWLCGLLSPLHAVHAAPPCLSSLGISIGFPRMPTGSVACLASTPAHVMRKKKSFPAHTCSAFRIPRAGSARLHT